MNLIKLPEVLAMTKCSKPFCYSKIEKGEAPKPIKLCDRAVAWLISDIPEWLDQRINQSKQENAA
ncbi:helix-turn-helix transcriptional regulator [Rheinheimera pacifica]|uniref:helix-turn-helix transcriptional regulator n=1 Tax=Rheinheimera pacifica TaxID=173990 RepID=UPI002ED849D4